MADGSSAPLATRSADATSLVGELTSQTARIWEFANGETKIELRGHEHVVECAAFAPLAAYAPIRELTGLTVSLFRERASVH